MKLRSFDVARNGDRVSVNVSFRDRFRQPLKVKVTTEADEMGASPQLWEGDAFDALGLFGGIAEIAWKMGWRPRGIEATLANAIKAYQIPKEGS